MSCSRSATTGTRSPTHLRDLRVQLALDLGMQREQVPRPGERLADRVVPLLQHADGFFVELLVGHALAGVRVARVHQHREEAALARCRRSRFCSMMLRDAVVQRAHRRVEAAVVGGRHPERQRRQGGHARLQHAQGGLRRPPAISDDVVPQLHAEQHVADDDERELGHLVVERRAPRRLSATSSQRSSISRGAARDDRREAVVCSRLKEGCTRRRCCRHVSPSAVSRLSPQ